MDDKLFKEYLEEQEIHSRKTVELLEELISAVGDQKQQGDTLREKIDELVEKELEFPETIKAHVENQPELKIPDKQKVEVENWQPYPDKVKLDKPDWWKDPERIDFPKEIKVSNFPRYPDFPRELSVKEPIWYKELIKQLSLPNLKSKTVNVALSGNNEIIPAVEGKSICVFAVRLHSHGYVSVKFVNGNTSIEGAVPLGIREGYTEAVTPQPIYLKQLRTTHLILTYQLMLK